MTHDSNIVMFQGCNPAQDVHTVRICLGFASHVSVSSGCWLSQRHGCFSEWFWNATAGLLEPLPVNAPNFRERLDSLLAAMGTDILGRVMGDKLDEDRLVLSRQGCIQIQQHGLHTSVK